MMRLVPITMVAFWIVVGGCTPPVAGNVDAGAKDAGSSDPLEEPRWEGTRVSAGVGDIHNILPEEKRAVVASIAYRLDEIKACFERPVRIRGCRTGGVPKSVDAMLMIDGEGRVNDVRIVPNKNDLSRECNDAIGCIRDLLGGVPIPGLSRFGGSRQAYMTITAYVPSDEDLRIRMEEGPRTTEP